MYSNANHNVTDFENNFFTEKEKYKYLENKILFSLQTKKKYFIIYQVL